MSTGSRQTAHAAETGEGEGEGEDEEVDPAAAEQVRLLAARPVCSHACV